jgi:hypothetical protein
MEEVTAIAIEADRGGESMVQWMAMMLRKTMMMRNLVHAEVIEEVESCVG